MQAAQQYRPEDRQRFIDYVRNEPMAAAQLRAPLFEDKVVDFLFAKAEISERKVSREDAPGRDRDRESGHVHGPDCDHDQITAGRRPKKAAAKKARPSRQGREGRRRQAEAKAKPAKKAADSGEGGAAEEAGQRSAPAKKAAKKKRLTDAAHEGRSCRGQRGPVRAPHRRPAALLQ